MSKQPDLKATILDEFREKFPTLQVETIEELLRAIKTIQKYPEQIEAFLSTAIDRVREEEMFHTRRIQRVGHLGYFVEISFSVDSQEDASKAQERLKEMCANDDLIQALTNLK